MARLQSFLPASSVLKPVPITAENFAPFGHIISTIARPGSAAETFVSPDGSVEKYDRLAPVLNQYKDEEGAVLGVGVFRATKKVGLVRGEEFEVRLLERHKYTSQSFIPMGKAEVSLTLWFVIRL